MAIFVHLLNESNGTLSNRGYVGCGMDHHLCGSAEKMTYHPKTTTTVMRKSVSIMPAGARIERVAKAITSSEERLHKKLELLDG